MANSVDPLLVSLSEAAERGDPVPRVRLLAGGSVAVGLPISRQEFLRRSEESLKAEWETYLQQRPRRERRDDKMQHSGEVVRANMASFTRTEAHDAEHALDLADVEWWPLGGGDGLNLPALRVPLSTIDAWWVAGGEVLKAPKETSWGFGAIFFPQF